MTYGLQVCRADGSIVYDSAAAMGGVFVDIVTMAAGASGSIVYSGVDVIGRTLRVHVLTAGGHSVTVSNDADGRPRLTYSPIASYEAGANSTVVVWAS